MRMLKFGQPAGAVFQVAYTVADMDEAIPHFTARLGVGPWFPINYHASENTRYRGKPTSPQLKLIRGFAGNINVELIQQLDGGPSVFRDIFEKRGHGFHHFGIGSVDFDHDVERYESLGYEMAFYDVSPFGSRIAYMDTTRDMPGFTELIEMTEKQEDLIYRIQQHARNFDGKDLIRTNP